MSKIQRENRMIKPIETLANSTKPLKTWYARRDSNAGPFAPEAYGRRR
jgi:hypothetical protein